jgi:3-oxo-4,17-pregnadiene-20-carboxyl-CoA hydratase alpha subunit
MTARWFPDEMPLPAASAETADWWQAAASHRLVIQRCSVCATVRHPPGPRCPVCRSGPGSAELVDLPGTGRVYTFTVVRQAFIPALTDRIPYVVAAVDLDGAPGARIVTNLVEVEPEDVAIGQDVVVAWEDMGPDLALPRFRPRSVP